MRQPLSHLTQQDHPLRLLVLEDNAADAALLTRELARAQMVTEIRQAATEEDFRRELAAFAPDAVLSDFELSGFTGYDAFRILAERALKIPFILVTGALPEAVVIEVIKTGIDDYILKKDLAHLPTALKNALEKKRAERDAAELDRLREKFVTITAHQLRTPLSVVKWSLEKLLDPDAPEIPEAARAAIMDALEANATLVSRIDDLLAVITIKEGRMLIKHEPVAIVSLTHALFEDWKVRCADKQLSCIATVRVPTERVLLDADAEKIRLAFAKMLDNAFRYTLPLGHVSASLSESGDMIRLEVSDTGIGIPEAEQSDIMRSFFRASNAIALWPDASGVGLAIARYCIEQHGGRMGFRSREREGSTFWCEIPVA